MRQLSEVLEEAEEVFKKLMELNQEAYDILVEPGPTKSQVEELVAGGLAYEELQWTRKKLHKLVQEWVDDKPKGKKNPYA